MNTITKSIDKNETKRIKIVNEYESVYVYVYVYDCNCTRYVVYRSPLGITCMHVCSILSDRGISGFLLLASIRVHSDRTNLNHGRAKRNLTNGPRARSNGRTRNYDCVALRFSLV